jgi:hypothetical protein
VQLGIAILAVTTGFAGYDRANLGPWQRGARVVGGFTVLSTITPLALFGAVLAIGAIALHRLTAARPAIAQTASTNIKAETTS